MTTEQRDILIEKMIDKPEDLTSEDIALILSDSELTELYEISVRLADELSTVPEIDIDGEWSKMQNLISGRRSVRRFRAKWMMVAASIVAVLICGGFLIKLSLSTEMSNEETLHLAKVDEAQIAAPSEISKRSANNMKLLADTIESCRIHRQIQKQKLVKVEEVADNDSIDIDEYLRIRQARIDNSIAEVMARVYQEDYSIGLEELSDILDEGGLDGDSVIIRYVNGININRITML